MKFEHLFYKRARFFLNIPEDDFVSIRKISDESNISYTHGIKTTLIFEEENLIDREEESMGLRLTEKGKKVKVLMEEIKNGLG